MRRLFNKLNAAASAAVLAAVFAAAVGARADEQSAVNQTKQRAQTLNQMRARTQKMQAQMASMHIMGSGTMEARIDMPQTMMWQMQVQMQSGPDHSGR